MKIIFSIVFVLIVLVCFNWRKDLLCWLIANADIASWFQALFASLAIFIVYWQTQKQIKNFDENQKKLALNNQFNRQLLAFNYAEWLIKKLDYLQTTITILCTKSHAIESDRDLDKLVTIQELRSFSRRLLLIINSDISSSNLNLEVEKLLNTLEKLVILIENDANFDRVMKEYWRAQSNCQSLINNCDLEIDNIADELGELEGY